MQFRMRSALIACAVLWACAPIESVIQRSSTKDKTLTWVCKDPTDEEKKVMIDGGNSNFQFSVTHDPVGFGGGCMPDATCDKNTRKSAWKNVFGYV